MAGTRRLTALAAEATSRLDLPDGDLVVALSGGADSAALAWLIGEAGRKVRAVHVDHGFPGSPLMREAAVAIAGRLDLDLRILEVVVADGPSPEAMAREARYAALAGAIGDGETLLTAHTADDNLETVLINLVRGTGTRGLAGIPRRGLAGAHRPLLEVSRDVTREIAALAGLPFADDPMNLDPNLARTHIRARVVPELRALNPDLVATVTRSSALVAADADLLDELEGVISVRETPDGLAIAVGELAAAPGAVAGRVLREALGALGAPRSAESVARALAVARGEATSARLGGGVTVTRRGAVLHLIGDTVEQSDVIALQPGVTRHAGLVFEVLRRDGVCRVAPLGKWGAVFPAGTSLTVGPDGVVHADGEPAWIPGRERLPVAWYQAGSVGYLSVLAREESGWTSSP